MRCWNKPTVLIAAGGVGLLLATRAVLRRRREDDLRDKVVLITGGSRGLGLVMARQLLRQGARVAICARDALEEVVLSPSAKLATMLHGLFPGLTADVLGLANTLLLPAPGGIGSARLPGKDSSSPLSPSWLTRLSDRAAQRNNEHA